MRGHESVANQTIGESMARAGVDPQIVTRKASEAPVGVLGPVDATMQAADIPESPVMIAPHLLPRGDHAAYLDQE